MTLNSTQRGLIFKIIDGLFSACVAEGGDGDVLWYSRHFSIVDILPVLKEYNANLKCPFEINVVDDVTINYGMNQEWITITNDYNLVLSGSKYSTTQVIT